MSEITKNAIKSAFTSLLEEKPLNQITIKELVRVCKINRNTFYYHYHSINDLVEEVMLDETDKITTAYPTPNSLEECVFAILDFVKENHRAIFHVYNSMSRATCEKFLWKVCRRFVESYWESADMKKHFTEVDSEIITDFYVAQCFGLAMHWLNTGMDVETARSGAARLYELRHDISGLLSDI